MPELPDVETFKRYFDSTALHQRINDVEVRNSRILSGISARKLKTALRANSFRSTCRQGKYLFARTDGGVWLALHFGMTGHLKYFKNLEQDEPYTRLLITFDNRFHLAYVCQRLLGRVTLTRSVEQFIESKNLGPDALDIDFDTLRNALARSKASIKSTLMNQARLAGIGNLYADEILFQSGIHPMTRSKQLDGANVEKIHHNVRKVLQMAIRRQADPRALPQSYLLPHRGRDGECPRCGGIIRHMKISGRTAYFCQTCQQATPGRRRA